MGVESPYEPQILRNENPSYNRVEECCNKYRENHFNHLDSFFSLLRFGSAAFIKVASAS